MPLSTVPDAIVVEDDPIIMMEAALILEDAGFRVYESFNGDEAILHLAEHWEGTVLLYSDVDMPGSIDGLALARHVAAHWPLIEIVIASGHVLPANGTCRKMRRLSRNPSISGWCMSTSTKFCQMTKSLSR